MNKTHIMNLLLHNQMTNILWNNMKMRVFYEGKDRGLRFLTTSIDLLNSSIRSENVNVEINQLLKN